MNFETAKELAIREMRTRSRKPDELLIAGEATIETADSWVFFYDSKGWLIDKDPHKRLMGNCPILIDKRFGRVRRVPTGGQGDLKEKISAIEDDLRKDHHKA